MSDPRHRALGTGSHNRLFVKIPSGARTLNGDDDAPLFDGGETGCGELLLDLLLFMRKQPTGAVVRVRALDPGAPLEIPAWCRMTNHTLLSSEHPFYSIQRPLQEKVKP